MNRSLRRIIILCSASMVILAIILMSGEKWLSTSNTVPSGPISVDVREPDEDMDNVRVAESSMPLAILDMGNIIEQSNSNVKGEAISVDSGFAESVEAISADGGFAESVEDEVPTETDAVPENPANVDAENGAIMAFYRLAPADVRLADLPMDTTQLVIVNSSGSRAKIHFFEKLEDGLWVEDEALRVNGYVGKHGTTNDKREGDLATPIGQFPVGSAFYIDSAPQTGLDSFLITENTYWVDDPDSDFYNRRVEGLADKDWDSAEHMIKNQPNYSYGFVIEYNIECTPGKGSAIFFHVSDKYTTGCVATSKRAMLRYLAVLDAGKNPYILII